MRLQESSISIAELLEQYNNGAITVNDEYQRQPRLWPPSARSYFIDTILSGFPFPKIYMLERIQRETMKPIKEIVDGQQRVQTIIDFARDRFALGSSSVQFRGQRFSTLSEEMRIGFISYAISLDVIRDAERSDILQMFRRMNAYTLPLNEAEKRHSEFFGAFKDWVNQRVTKWGRLLSDWKVLSSRAIVRMEDAELFAEVALAMREGIQSSSAAKLRKIYRELDAEFAESDDWADKVDQALAVIQTDLSDLQRTYLTKSYAFLSLLIALIHNRWGIPGLAEATGVQPTHTFINVPGALGTLTDLAFAHETKDTHGPYRRYADACLAGSNRLPQRTTRAEFLLKALQGTL